MRRREVIGLLGSAAAAWPLTARAQQPNKVWRVGFFSGTSRSAVSGLYAGFVRGMTELGYAEGKNFIIEWRSAEEKYERAQPK
jgi:putative ABC transport system substrate-binding protein